MWLSLASYISVGIGIGLLDFDLMGALGRALVDAGLLLGLTWAALRFVGHMPRFPQTITALAASGTFLSLFSWPVLAMAHQVKGTDTESIVGLLWLVILAWSLAVFSHVLRHALDIRFSNAVMLTVVYVVITITVMTALWPPEAIQ
jgi:hypothetical protein